MDLPYPGAIMRATRDYSNRIGDMEFSLSVELSGAFGEFVSNLYDS